MKNILINGLNAKAGGGKSILNNYLQILKSEADINRYFVLTPNKISYLKYENSTLKIIDIHAFFKISVMLPFTYNFVLKNMIKKYNIDTVFNLADVPIVTNVNQIYLFDWPYAVYPKSSVWETMKLKDLLTRKIKLLFFKKNLKYVNFFIAQNIAMKKRLEEIYGITKISVVNNAVSLDNLKEEIKLDFELPKGNNLLYLTHYYPHKNLEILIPLAIKIKEYGLNYQIITTVSEEQGEGALEFLDNIKNNRLEDYILNIGPVEMEYVPSLYKQCDGLLMPTLLESFSGTYVEAMFHKIPIITSEFDFSKAVCGEAAVYFNPFDEDDILKKIESIFTDDILKHNMLIEAKKKLNELSTWEESFAQYQNIIKQ